MGWFKSWFNTPYYHILYKNRDFDEAENFIKNLIQHLRPPEGSKMMDLCCGKGRHSIFLNKMGYQVLGLDLSEKSIEQAILSKNKTLSFDVHDMREIYQESSFDYIFNLFTSFGYFPSEKENAQVFQSVYQELKPNGIFVIDFLNVEKTLTHLVENETKTIDDIVFKITRKKEKGFIVKDIIFEADNENHHYTERIKIIRKEEFDRYISQANFKTLATFGSYDLTEFNTTSSNRLIHIIQKK